MKLELSSRTTTVLLGEASRIYSKQDVASLCSFFLTFFSGISLESKEYIRTVVPTRSQFESNPLFISI